MSVIPREQYDYTRTINHPSSRTCSPIYKRSLVKTQGTRIRNILRQRTSFRWGKPDQSTRETAPFSRCRKSDLQVYSLHLRETTIRIHDGFTHSQGIQQTNGILQGDLISPLVFNVLAHDVVQRIQTEEVRMWLYADDMILLSERRESLKETIKIGIVIP